MHDDALDAILVNDESKKEFLALAGAVDSLFLSILPDPAANEFSPARAALQNLVRSIRSMTPVADISGVMSEVNRILDRSIATEGYVIREGKAGPGSDEHLVDLSRLDFDALQRQFANGHKHTQAERLRGSIDRRLKRMVDLNHTRLDLLDRFQRLIDEYNTGSMNFEEYIRQLMELTDAMNAEDQRAVSEGLSEEELALFDLLTKPDIKLSKSREHEVKAVAQDLIEALKREKLVLDWRKRQQTRAAVRLAIEETLDRLPDSYSKDDYDGRCEAVYLHIYESYFGSGRSVYAQAA